LTLLDASIPVHKNLKLLPNAEVRELKICRLDPNITAAGRADSARKTNFDDSTSRQLCFNNCVVQEIVVIKKNLK